MPKEVKDTRDNRSGGSGGDGGEDGLEQAAEQAAKFNDKSLASLFVEANQEAQELDLPPIRELFVEEKKKIDFQESDPDPHLLQEIYDSLANKEVHHKKLLEEGIPTNFFLRILFYLQALFKIQRTTELQTVLTPQPWKYFCFCHKYWKKSLNVYWNDFSSLTDLWLRNDKITRKILTVEALVLGLISVLCFPVIVLFSKNPFAVNASQLGFANVWSNAIFSSAIISFILALVPPIFFMSLWFVNVNHLHTSKNFHFFLFSLTTLSFFFLLLAWFNAGLYHLIDWRFGFTNTPIPSTESPPPTPPVPQATS